MRTLLAAMLMTLMPTGATAWGEPYACNMNALTKSERAAHKKLSGTLFESVQEMTEIPNGYAFRLPSDALVKTAQWVAFERKCCPFFTFELELAKDEGPLWLRVTGSKGIKEFIREEFQLGS